MRLLIWVVIGYVLYRVVKMFMNAVTPKDKGVVTGEKTSKEKTKHEKIIDAEFKDLE